MSSEFDASQVYQEPLSGDVMAGQDQTVANLMQRPSALANAKLHAENELQRIINVSNRLAWGEVPGTLREPTQEEAAALMERLSQEDRHKLLNEARLGAEQRRLLAKMEDAHQQCVAQWQAEQKALELREQEELEWAEFEAFDAAGKEQRFNEWRAARRQAS